VLDEFTRLTGCHRKSAVRLLGTKPARQVTVHANGHAVKLKPGKRRPGNRKGRPVYGDEAIGSLRKVWAFFRYKRGKILAPLLRRQIARIASRPAFGITPEIAARLARISPATIDRRLRKDRAALALRGKSLAKPGDSLKSRIPIRAFHASEERRKPGFRQIDTVHRCGQATNGQYLHTLTATDVFSGWVEPRATLNNAHKRVFQELSGVRASVPLPVSEFHGDNGSEFISHATEAWRAREGVAFTRSRSRNKNDDCFVERKNGAVVREYVGYDRLEGAEELALLSEVYAHPAPPLNFFMPTRRLESKTGIGSREVKTHDEPRTPFQGLMESAEVPPETKDALSARIALCSPVELQDNVNKAVMRLRRRLARASRKQTGGGHSFGNIF